VVCNEFIRVKKGNGEDGNEPSGCINCKEVLE
jgi:hypothetical protein